MNKIIFIVGGVIVAIAVVFLFYFLSARGATSQRQASDRAATIPSRILQGGTSGKKQADCNIKTEERIVRGNSLTGLVEPGQTIKIILGFYGCNEIKKGDIVVYQYAGNAEPIIKIVKGVPNDIFGFEKSPAGCWGIIINGEKIQESRGADYCIGDAGYRVLSLYEKDYHGVIPGGTYLLLGNVASGSMDSSKFGLAAKSDIIGKVTDHF